MKKFFILLLPVLFFMSDKIYSAIENSSMNTSMSSLDRAEKILIGIPTYNEKENIIPLCEAILSTAPYADILIIDDNSPDGTGIIADKLASEDSRIKVLHRPSKLGLGTAQIASYDYAHEHAYDYLITMDADFTHDPKYIPALVNARENADVVIGSRYAEGAAIKDWGKFRLLLTRFWRNCLRLGTGMSYDCTGAYRLYRVSALDPEIYRAIKTPGYSFGLELLFKLHAAGARIVQVPIVAYGRVLGKSKLSTKEMWQMVKTYAHIIGLRVSNKANDLRKK